jgi:hypothetical protein
MKRLAPLAFVTVLAVLLGAAQGGDKGEKKGDKADKSDTSLDNPYMPLKVGTTWEYASGPKKVTVKVAAHEELPNVGKCAKLVSDAGGNTTNEHLMVNKEGIFRVRANGNDITPPILVLKFPPKKGEEWTINSKTDRFAIKGKVAIADETKVTVGKEEYTTFLVKTSDLTMGDQSASNEAWYAKDRGMVKQHFRIPGASLDVTLELEKFTPGQ